MNTTDILYKVDGTVDKDTPGWAFISSEDQEMTFNEFEGYYANKGGKLIGPELDTSNQAFEFIKFTFEYAVPQNTYAGIFFYNKDGQELPDDYTGLEPTGDFVRFEKVFYGRETQVVCRPFFQTKNGVKIRNVVIEKITAGQAAEWCDSIYQLCPSLNYTPPADRFRFIPRTMKALNDGTPWRILMLGDSIINDTFNSNFQSLIMRMYPRSKVKFIDSVRGSTGCWYYHKPEHFKEYVFDWKPDLLIIGGISNVNNNSNQKAINYIRKVITMARDQLDCEIMLLSGPIGAAWREGTKENGAKPVDEQYKPPVDFWNAQEKLAAEMNVEFQHQGLLWREYLNICGKPRKWFNKDTAHGNVRGRQIVGRMLEAYFNPVP